MKAWNWENLWGTGEVSLSDDGTAVVVEANHCDYINEFFAAFLTREQAGALAKLLQVFSETGELPGGE